MKRVDLREVLSRSPEETRRLGVRFAGRLQPGDVLALTGEIGAGKTVFVQGLAEGLGVDSGSVASPSFVLVREYAGRIPLYHVDLYRLDRLPEVHLLGLEEYYEAGGVTVVEWGTRIPEALPPDYLEIRFEFIDPQTRKLEWLAHGARYQQRATSN